MAAKKKTGGGKLSRSEVVTVRLDPKLRFAAELAARRQRRTLSSFIEWAIGEAVNRVEITDSENVNDIVAQVWDVEEADRFIKLALNFPEFLSFDEERLWKIIKNCKNFWLSTPPRGSSSIDETSIAYPMLRSYWETLQMVIAGEATEEDLEKPLF